MSWYNEYSYVALLRLKPNNRTKWWEVRLATIQAKRGYHAAVRIWQYFEAACWWGEDWWELYSLKIVCRQSSESLLPIKFQNFPYILWIHLQDRANNHLKSSMHLVSIIQGRIIPHNTEIYPSFCTLNLSSIRGMRASARNKHRLQYFCIHFCYRSLNACRFVHRIQVSYSAIRKCFRIRIVVF